jgi:hypothetical protein
MQKKDVMRGHVPYCEHGDRGDRDSEVWVSDRPLVAARMELSDHQSQFYSEVLQMPVRRIQALPALRAQLRHNYQPALEDHSASMWRSVRIAELADLRSQLIPQVRLAGSVDVVSYAGVQSVLIERTRNEGADGSRSSDSSVANGHILSQPSVCQPEVLVGMVLICGGVAAHWNSTRREFVRLSKILHAAIQSGDAHVRRPGRARELEK